MIRISEIKLPLTALPVQSRRAADAPHETEIDRTTPPHPDEALRQKAAQALSLDPSELAALHVFKRSFDARKADILAVYIVDVQLKDTQQEALVLAQHAAHPYIQATPNMQWQPPCHAPARFGEHKNELKNEDKSKNKSERPVVVGFGPCGMFAALVLAQMGFKPIVIERGTTVRQRTKDTWGLWRKKVLNAESNVQFGEGGAGTFSDGKLYSQIKDPRHLGRKVLTEFVKAGAPPEILTEAHPHIGTFRLVKMVENMRATIESLGGEYRFETRVTDFDIETRADGTRQLRGVVLASGEHIAADHVVLAVGHSSRDTFQILHDRGVYVEAKPFSIGFRIEHPQSLVDIARFGPSAGNPILGAADYKLVHHASNGRGVYSFCMCPGGTVVAATSEEGRVVTNGMSQYSRAERNANAGIVVGITPEEDYPGGPLAGIAFQRKWESAAFVAGGGTYAAPAQRVGDFLAGRASTSLGKVIPSYKPGVFPTDLSSCLPNYAIVAIREALKKFGRQIKGYDMPDAVLTGVETRTSSPIRIKRDDNYQSLNTKGLYPAGEGAGYAGGILSAGVDGIKVAEAVAQSMLGVQST